MPCRMKRAEASERGAPRGGWHSRLVLRDGPDWAVIFLLRHPMPKSNRVYLSREYFTFELGPGLVVE